MKLDKKLDPEAVRSHAKLHMDEAAAGFPKP